MRIISLLIALMFSFNSFSQNDSIELVSDLKETIQDTAIVVPESLNTALDSLLSDWFLSQHLYVDSLCISGYDDIVYHDSVYIQRLASLPNVIEMPYNPIVRSYIDLYAKKRRSLVEYMLGLSNYYFPLFEEVLDREDAPLELRILPIIESALKPTARSKMGATGLWQFMLPTAKYMGLEVTSLTDDRCDPVKSTEAAVRYLKHLYKIYDDWTLAIAAYNCGPGNVNKAIKRAGGKRDYWDIYFHLPKETRGYVPAFIAANYIMTYYCEHNLCPVLTDLPIHNDTVVVNQMIHFEQIADHLDVSIDHLRSLNPQYRSDIVPGNIGPKTLRLPVQQLYTFIEHEDSIASYRSTELLVNNRREIHPGGTTPITGTVIHKVKSGETLSVIARKYGTNVANIKQLNSLKNDNLKIGQQLVVSGKRNNSGTT